MERKLLTKWTVASALGFSLATIGVAGAQVAGTTTLGIEVTRVEAVAKGWSLKKALLDQSIFNDKGEEIGTVADVIVTPEESLSYAIISDGGYLGIAEHYVAIPIDQIKIVKNKFQLPGATKDALQKAPAFKYAN